MNGECKCQRQTSNPDFSIQLPQLSINQQALRSRLKMFLQLTEINKYKKKSLQSVYKWHPYSA